MPQRTAGSYQADAIERPYNQCKIDIALRNCITLRRRIASGQPYWDRALTGGKQMKIVLRIVAVSANTDGRRLVPAKASAYCRKKFHEAGQTRWAIYGWNVAVAAGYSPAYSRPDITA